MPIHPPFAHDDELAAIAAGLLDRSLPKLRWNHAGHFAATLWVLTRRPAIEAPRDMPGIIRAYNMASGGRNTATEGYHETITQASIRAAGAFLKDNPEGPLHMRCNALLAGPLGNPAWLLAYWSHDLLFSVPARRLWLPPDLVPLPF